MLVVLNRSWALLLGMLLLMVGNGLQGSLLGVRGAEAGFSPFVMSIVMSAFFFGFIIASQVAPLMIQRVGHVRVFAALGSIISAVLILFPALPYAGFWIAGRIVLGFAFCGLYVTAESWLNNASTNATRGQALSLYIIVQMLGVIAAQALLNLPDPSGFLLFVIPSVLVSLAFAPILLTVTPTPAFESTKRMTLRELFTSSPLGCIGMALMGVVFALQYGMAAVYAVEAGLTLAQTSIFIAAFYVGALIFQYPLGMLSDRIDRRIVIAFTAAMGGIAATTAALFSGNFSVLVAAAVLIGGAANPLYSLLIAHTSDFLDYEDMAAASAGLQFLNGIFAVIGPLVTGYLMVQTGPQAFFVLIALPMLLLVGYALYRATRRPVAEDTNEFVPMLHTSSVMSLEAAQDIWTEDEPDEADASDPGDGAARPQVA
ncbi:putative MFS-type transporter YcaD [Roseivivax sp. THAF40]|uniref:MFS transporter n=1 Tax=unclassified Roseivivax TaxID=2639302 RepID=UPI001268C0E8|nr:MULTISPECIES: MFS transporter [unclassified Roseivivax]QFS82793.1 putative MFS-type transporter YcaD [Roseivivax sp. THAF197b]QFT46562.1 putative MFS-type transporter YcaD [Roseivivax sp. THAF40]